MTQAPGRTWKVKKKGWLRRRVLWRVVYPFIGIWILASVDDFTRRIAGRYPSLLMFVLVLYLDLGFYVLLYLFARFGNRALRPAIEGGRSMLVINRLRRPLVVSEALLAGVSLSTKGRLRRRQVATLVLRTGQRIRVPGVYSSAGRRGALANWDRLKSRVGIANGLDQLALAVSDGDAADERHTRAPRRRLVKRLPRTWRSAYTVSNGDPFYEAFFGVVVMAGIRLWGTWGEWRYGVGTYLVVQFAMMSPLLIGYFIWGHRQVHRAVIGDDWIAFHRVFSGKWEYYEFGALTGAAFLTEGHRLSTKLFGTRVEPRGRTLAIFDADGHRFSFRVRHIPSEFRAELTFMLETWGLVNATTASALGGTALALDASASDVPARAAMQAAS